ncbi:MAG TPA: amidinotransferase [Actinophytocola sp.]|uniref:amidinotransferase n=1 Tax=Actinophytocola sp. TaxID=1872138 RepID=UPI002E0BB0A5|nr:amidinotransferase [Actinophytocola sp.]
MPAWDVALEATMPARSKLFFVDNAGNSFPAEQARLAELELAVFAETLQRLGITVARPAPLDHRRPFSTPNWKSPSGLYSMMPRDLLLVVGDTIIEAPMAWRARYFEIDAYRHLLFSYFQRGARWISAPRPQLRAEWYDDGFDHEEPHTTGRYVTGEFEPTFDAADFVRCGRDIFAQRSHVTNRSGIDWVTRHLGSDYTVHTLDIADRAPMHIDATFMPLAPGKILVNPSRAVSLPAALQAWDVRLAPPPAVPGDHTLYFSSPWISMNVLMLDQQRVVVEAGERPLIEMLEGWDFEVLPLPFRNVMRFGGCFHCVTADVRRRGTLESYL